MLAKFRCMCADDKGTTAIEYAIIVSLISCGLVLSIPSIGSGIGLILSTVADGMSGDGKTAPPQSAPQQIRH